MRRLILAVLLLAGCDLCSAAIAIHQDKCLQGVQESCEWLQHNAPGPACVP